MEESNILKDFDVFFYYGSNDLTIETKSDIMQNITQPKRSLFYDRDLDSAGIKDFENMPNGVFVDIILPYQIVSSISKRNQYVSAGENGRKDRRVALSQNTIRVERNGPNVNVSVLYISLADFKQTETTPLSIGFSS